ARSATWRTARNRVRGAQGSIHDDDAARRLGFAGGLVGGNVHMVFVTQALVERFGAPWYERGALRFTWARPVFDGEEVRVELDGDAFSLVKRDGTVACAGRADLAGTAPWERPGAEAPSPVGEYDPLPESVGDA